MNSPLKCIFYTYNSCTVSLNLNLPLNQFFTTLVLIKSNNIWSVFDVNVLMPVVADTNS